MVEANRYLLDTDMNEFARRYASDMIRPLDDLMTGKPIKVDLFPQGAADTAPFDAVERVLRDESMADMDGLVTGVVVLDELGQRTKDIAKQTVGLNLQTNHRLHSVGRTSLRHERQDSDVCCASSQGKRYSSDLMVFNNGFDRVLTVMSRCLWF